MTGRTHDLSAFTALNIVLITHPIPEMSLATAIAAFSGNMIGGLAPDIDQPTADLWGRLPAGGVISRVFTPFLGGHRFISHSLLGIFILGLGSKFLLELLSNVVLVDMDIVWIAFMIGFISHLIMDSFTKEGVPWLFPIPIRLGFPPFRFLRVKTSGMMEKSVIFPLLMVINAYLIYTHYDTFLNLFRTIVK